MTESLPRMACVWAEICPNSPNRPIWQQNQMVIYTMTYEWTIA